MAERVMGADHIAEGGGGGKFEPQRPFNYQLVLPKDKVGGAEDIKLSVLSFTVPKISNEPIVIPFLNEDRKVAGPVSFEAANLTVVDYINPDVLGGLQEWRDKVYDGGEDGTGGIGLASDYKADADLQMFGPKSPDTNKRRWHIIGLWPVSIDHGEFNMGSRTDYKQVTVVFAVDRMYLVQGS